MGVTGTATSNLLTRPAMSSSRFPVTWRDQMFFVQRLSHDEIISWKAYRNSMNDIIDIILYWRKVFMLHACAIAFHQLRAWVLISRLIFGMSQITVLGIFLKFNRSSNRSNLAVNFTFCSLLGMSWDGTATKQKETYLKKQQCSTLDPNTALIRNCFNSFQSFLSTDFPGPVTGQTTSNGRDSRDPQTPRIPRGPKLRVEGGLLGPERGCHRRGRPGLCLLQPESPRDGAAARWATILGEPWAPRDDPLRGTPPFQAPEMLRDQLTQPFSYRIFGWVFQCVSV